jgi:hypothetical protein
MAKAILETHPYYDVYVSEQNMGFWKVVMKGVPSFVLSILITAAWKCILGWYLFDVA